MLEFYESFRCYDFWVIKRASFAICAVGAFEKFILPSYVCVLGGLRSELRSVFICLRLVAGPCLRFVFQATDVAELSMGYGKAVHLDVEFDSLEVFRCVGQWSTAEGIGLEKIHFMNQIQP